MRKRPVLVAPCLLTGTVLADSITKTAQEDDREAYPVTRADRSKAYGDDPDDRGVPGVVSAPAGSGEYRTLEVPGHGPDGAPAGIHSVFFSATESRSDK